MISRIINDATIGSLSLVFTLFLANVCNDSGLSVECRKDSEYDEYAMMNDETNVDEDDEKDFGQLSFTEITIITTTGSTDGKMARPKCSEDKIMYYLAELQVINPETILQIASYNDLDRSCRKIGNNLKSIDALMKTCAPLPQTHLYTQLITGVRVFHAKLCVQSDYQLAFKGYVGCFRELHNEYIDCGGPADWTENMDYSELCAEYKAISDCYYTQTALLCGTKAAKTMKELVVRVINAVIEVRCPEVRKNPSVEDPMPEHAVYVRQSSACMKILPSFDKRYALTVLLTMYRIIA